jgi:ABC-type Fe3+-hydroxamate transport system substrate-binding protein
MENYTFVDQLGRSIRIPKKPIRIISLVPSQTELLAYFGLDKEVVGITKFCIHPKKWHQERVRIGGTKKVDIQKIRALKPDLIIGNKEENTQQDIEQLESFCTVWLSDVNSYEDALWMIKNLGEILDKETLSNELLSKIESNFKALNPIKKQKKVLYLIWDKPLISVGRNTFIHSILEKIGFENSVLDDRYPTIEKSMQIAPDILLLSSEPYPFGTNHIKTFQLKYPETKVILVDGEMFSWYGPRMIEAPNYFGKLIMDIGI